MAHHVRHGELPLAPVAPDRFQGSMWWFGALRFERDPAGAVTGFRLSGARVRNLRFVRVSDPGTRLLSAEGE